MPDAIRFFVPDNPVQARTFHAKLVQQRHDAMVQLASGYAQDWPDYRKRVGFIEGLGVAIKLIEEAEEQRD